MVLARNEHAAFHDLDTGAELKQRDTSDTPSKGENASNIRALLIDTWICEATAVLFSSACVIAIALIVRHYNNEPIPQFHSGLTLNSIVSILSTAARSAIIMTVSTSLGQLKWCWYKASTRRLKDAQTIDDASRGLLGSVILIFSRTGGFLAILGATVTFDMAAFSPFFQQLLVYPTRTSKVLTPDASVLQNVNFTINTSLDTPDGKDLYSAMMSGVFADPETFARTPVCPTAHCEWPTYRSVEWCSLCEDYTTRAAFEDDCDYKRHIQNTSLLENVALFEFCRVSLGQVNPVSLMSLEPTEEGYALQLLPDQSVPSFAYHKVDTERIWSVGGMAHDEQFVYPATYMGVDNPLLVMGHVVIDHESGPYRILEASQCLITLCEREYDTRVVGGGSSSKLMTTNYGRLFGYDPIGSDSSSDWAIGWQPYAERVTFTSDINTSFLDQSKRAFRPVARYPKMFASVLERNKTQIVIYSNDSEIDSGIELLSSEGANGSRRSSSPIRNLSTSLEGLAASLTNHGLGKTNHSLAGYAFYKDVYVHVRWKWILLPMMLQLSNVVLFLATVVYTKRIGAPIWKSSLLAIWYHGVAELHGSADSGLERLSEMERVAYATAVRLDKSDINSSHVFRRGLDKKLSMDE